jgi:hypothetical protein
VEALGFDIDNRPGRGMIGSKMAAAGQGMSPLASENYEMVSDALDSLRPNSARSTPVRSAPRQRSLLRNFEQRLKAENDATLIGRPCSISRKEIGAKRVDLRVGLLHRHVGGWQFSAGGESRRGSASSSADSSACSVSMVSSEASSPAEKNS